jgi:hypothetical protein
MYRLVGRSPHLHSRTRPAFERGFFIGESKVYADFSRREQLSVKSYRFRSHTGKRGVLPGAAPTMPQRAFHDGYMTGWQWIRGEDEVPAIPVYSASGDETRPEGRPGRLCLTSKAGDQFRTN